MPIMQHSAYYCKTLVQILLCCQLRGAAAPLNLKGMRKRSLLPHASYKNLFLQELLTQGRTTDLPCCHLWIFNHILLGPNPHEKSQYHIGLYHSKT